MSTSSIQPGDPTGRAPWNKGRLVGQKPPLKLQEIRAIRIRLQLSKRLRDLALFDLTIDSKLRGCDLVRLRVHDVAHGGHVLARATVIQQKTGRGVRFELSEETREAVRAWIYSRHLAAGSFPFPSRSRQSPHLSTRQSARIVREWVRPHRARPGRLRHTLPAAHEGDVDLPAHQEPPRRAPATRAHQVGMHRANSALS